MYDIIGGCLVILLIFFFAVLTIAICFGISFLLTALFYWIFTWIMITFFGITIPFTLDYVLGVWFLVLLFDTITSGIKMAIKNN